MRNGLPALLLVVSSCMIPVSALAADASHVLTVEQADETLRSKQIEVDESAKQVALQKTAIKQAQQKQERLEAESIQLDKAFAKAKQALDKDFSKIADNPDIDIRPSQGAYQNAWSAIKENQNNRLKAEQHIQELMAELSLFEADYKRLESELTNLNEQHTRARVARLRSELSRREELKVSFTNACQSNMTIGQCADQTKTLALQKAVNQFQDSLVQSTTEQKTVASHLSDVSLNIHVVGQKVLKDSFSENSRYLSVLDVSMEARPAKNVPCKLLGVGSNYCFDKGTDESNAQQQEIQWVPLTVRSNQYNDKVSIDGVNYGSTPVDIMLPVGLHMVTIEKEGYRSFHQELKITGDHTLKAVLREYENLPHSGKTFADALKDKSKAPQMNVIGSGEYLIGEYGAMQVNIAKAYSISAAPITVAQFEKFVNSTGYQTDAELTKVCTAAKETQIVPIANSYWRDPGFKQGPAHPVVCISQTDAIAYTKWLSKETGFKYRLPTETEWEVAARSGAKTAYWWGDSFSSGQANTGWGGTKWSNIGTSPVKSFDANGFGLYDVVGNVWEWTSAPDGITKGGSWSFSPNQSTAFSQLYLAPNTAANYVGFRILREL